MKNQMYSIEDKIAKLFLPVFLARNNNQAIRTFQTATNTPGHPFAQNPKDYTLFCLAEWDEDSGGIQVLIEPKNLGSASDFVKKEEKII